MSASMGRVKVVLLGTAHPHIFSRLKYLAERDDIDVLGYYETDPLISERMEVHAGCKRHTNLDTLLALSFDAALIHGYDSENALYMRRAIDAGTRGIFVEKPGVSQPAEFPAIAEDMSTRGIVLECGWELHYTAPVRLARQFVRDGLLGSITMARFHGGCPSGAGAEVWQSLPSNIGGFLYSIGGHTIESVVDLFGLPRRVVTSIRSLPRQPQHKGFAMMPDVFGPKIFDPVVSVGSLTHEDIGAAILEYADFDVTLDLTAWEPNGYCEEWAIDIYGTRGALHLTPDPPSGTLLLHEDVGGWKKGRHLLFKDDDGKSKLSDAFQMQMSAFFDRLNGLPVAERPCDEVLTGELLKLFQAMYKSKDERSWVDL